MMENVVDLGPVLLSRLQFAFTIIYHIIFPTFSIGLSAYIATLCVVWMRTGKEHYRILAQFQTKIFAVAFAMAVVAGIVLSHEFGTNWSRFSAAFGNVIGPMMAYETEAAFFWKRHFSASMPFGWNRVPPQLHTLSAIVIAVGTLPDATDRVNVIAYLKTLK